MCLDELPKETGVRNHICTVPAPSASPPRSDASRNVFALSAWGAAGLLCCDGALLARGQPTLFRYLLVCLSLTTFESSDQTHFNKG